MNIKVCGITSMKQLQQLDGLDIDYAGLNFYKKSPRYMGDKISGEDLILADLDIRKVGVFVNQEYDEIMKIADEYELDIVQLHGDETAHLCGKIADNVEVIKVFRIDQESSDLIDLRLQEFDEVCDYYLFDTASRTEFGGTGQKFDWKVLEESKIEKPFFISGGIGPDDAAAVRKFKHPDFFGVDINSRFEKEPGVKDMSLVLKFREGLKK